MIFVQPETKHTSASTASFRHGTGELSSVSRGRFLIQAKSFLSSLLLTALILLLSSSTLDISAQDLYVIQSGNWNDINTWSATSGGGTCNCVPGPNDNVHINETGAGWTVNMNGAGDARDLTIYNGGTLVWTADAILQINNGGTITVALGGTLNEAGWAGARINFVTDGSDYLIDNEGSFSINGLQLLNAGGSLTLTGSSDITVVNRLEILDNDVTLTNNHTGTVSTQGDLRMDGGGI